MVDGPEQVTADPKQIQHNTMHRQEPLRVGDRAEASHLTFALTGRLVRHFRAIVLVLPRAVYHGRHDGAERRRVAAQLIGDQTERSTTLPFQQLPEEPHSGVAIAARLHEDVDDVAVLVHGRQRYCRRP